MQIDDKLNYKNIWTKKIANAKNDRRNRDANFKIFKIYCSKFKKYMTLTRFVKKLSKLAMKIFTSQKTCFLNYILFDERLLQKQSNQITTFIFSKFISHFEIIRIKIKIIFVCKETRLERGFERDLNEDLSKTRMRTWSRNWIHIITSNSITILRIRLFNWFWLDITTHSSINFDLSRVTSFK